MREKVAAHDPLIPWAGRRPARSSLPARNAARTGDEGGAASG
ncbi:hypothetical protein ACFSTC_16410 [Nonomuraea ferruginea]